MSISEIRGALKRRWYLSLVVVVAAAGIAYEVHGKLTTIPTGSATVQLLVDSPSSSLVNVNANSAGLTSQAAVLAQALTSNSAIAAIAHAAGVPGGDVTAAGPYSGTGAVLDVPTPSESRGMQIVSEAPQFHLSFVAEQNIPIVTVSVTGPTIASANKFANAVLPGTETWLSSLVVPGTLSDKNRIVLRQLGQPAASVVNSSSAKLVAGIAFIAIMILGFLAVAMIDGRRARRAALKLDDTAPVDAESAEDAIDHRLLGVPDFADPDRVRLDEPALITQRRTAVSAQNGVHDPAGSPLTR